MGAFINTFLHPIGSAPVTLVLTLDAPAVDYSAYYPGTYAACNVVVTGGHVNDCMLEFSDDAGASWGLLALLDDNGDGNWGGSYDFSGYGATGEFLLRFKASNAVGTYFYSDEVAATIASPTIAVTSPAANSNINVNSNFSASVSVAEDSGTVTEAWIYVYPGGLGYALAYSSNFGGLDRYAGTATAPASSEVGSIVGKMTIEGIEITSPARSINWIAS